MLVLSELIGGEICFFQLLELFKMDTSFGFGDPFPLCDLAQVIVVQDGRDVEPEIKVAILRLKVHLEVAPYSLIKIV